MASEAASIDREGEESRSAVSFSREERQILLSVLEARVACLLGEGWGMHCSAWVWLLLPVNSAHTPR